MRAWIAVVAGLLAGPAAGQAVDRESFSVLGWNDSCSVAVSHYGYPALGQALYDEPIRALVGALTIPPGSQSARVSWSLDLDGASTWQPAAAKKAAADLAAAGYDRAGFREDIGRVTGGSRAPDEAVIHSTAVFSLRASAGWPGPGWRWDQVHYSPLDDCGLFVFRKAPAPRPFYYYVLLRLYNKSARVLRAQAHLEASGLLLRDDMDLAGALEEAADAARMAPALGPARYQHAALLSLSGLFDQALAELEAAVRIEPKYKAQARKDPDFETLRGHHQFKRLTLK